jgi:RNA polymerase sigma factor (sigma-70 family)
LTRSHNGAVGPGLGDNHLAEDAFQATFLVLARRANDVRPREALASWIYGVAVRTAKRVRTVAIHHRLREISMSTLSEYKGKADEVLDNEAIRILDEEISSLPDHLRVVVVLCELEGQSRKEVAEKLGLAEGTLSSRLAKARKRLAYLLRQRGITLSVTSLTLALARSSSAKPSSVLTIKAVLTGTREIVPAQVAMVSHEVSRMMFLQKLEATLPLAVMASGLLACATFAAVPRPDMTPVPTHSLLHKNTSVITAIKSAPAPAKVDPKPLPKGPNKLLFYRAGRLSLMNPGAKEEVKVSEDQSKFLPGFARLSPDGRKLAVLIQVSLDIPEGRNDPPRKLYARELSEKDPGLDLEIKCQHFAWSPDGTIIATTNIEEGPDKKNIFINKLVDVKTKEKKLLKLPDNHIITDWTRDGKYFLTQSITFKEDKEISRLHLMNMDGTEHKVLHEGYQYPSSARVSADGKHVLFSTMQAPPQNEVRLRDELMVLDIASGKTTLVAVLPMNGDVQSFCWSQDGKQIAYTWRERHDGKPEEVSRKETESHLVICDPDGKKQKTIASEKGEGQWDITNGQVDWR